MAETDSAAARRRLGVPDTKPRPRAQSLWLLASVVLAGLAVLSAGDRLDAAGAEATAGLEAADLMELADQQAERPPIRSSRSIPDAEGELAPASPSTETMLSHEEAVGRAALAEISYPWRVLLSDWTIEFLPARDGLYGLTLVPDRRIEIYVRDDQSHEAVAHVIAHELGHAIDVTLNSGPDRRLWEQARGIGSAPWWPDSGATDFETGAGDFAESFAAWQMGPDDFRSKLGPPPDQAQIELLATLSAS